MSAKLAGLVLFCFVMSATPGPNNMMVMASGARYGLRRTLPHVLGVALGFPAMLAVIGAGLGQAILASRAVHEALEAVSVLFMLWIASRIAGAGAPHEAQEKSTVPLSFFEAALFQWINPKAWAIGFVAIALYVHGYGSLWVGLALVCGIFIVICLLSLLAWTALGRSIGGRMRRDWQFRLFNGAMAALLVLAMVPLAWGG